MFLVILVEKNSDSIIITWGSNFFCNLMSCHERSYVKFGWIPMPQPNNLLLFILVKIVILPLPVIVLVTKSAWTIFFDDSFGVRWIVIAPHWCKKPLSVCFPLSFWILSFEHKVIVHQQLWDVFMVYANYFSYLYYRSNRILIKSRWIAKSQVNNRLLFLLCNSEVAFSADSTLILSNLYSFIFIIEYE